MPLSYLLSDILYFRLPLLIIILLANLPASLLASLPKSLPKRLPPSLLPSLTAILNSSLGGNGISKTGIICGGDLAEYEVE